MGDRVRVQFPVWDIHLVTSHPSQLSLAIPSWIGAMSNSEKAVTPCGWGVKAVLGVWVAGKTALSPCYTRAISERFKDAASMISWLVEEVPFLNQSFSRATMRSIYARSFYRPLSGCLSVCLSVKRVDCDKTKAPSEKVQL